MQTFMNVCAIYICVCMCVCVCTQGPANHSCVWGTFEDPSPLKPLSRVHDSQHELLEHSHEDVGTERWQSSNEIRGTGLMLRGRASYDPHMGRSSTVSVPHYNRCLTRGLGQWV